jgi:hypothetical protein
VAACGAAAARRSPAPASITQGAATRQWRSLGRPRHLAGTMIMPNHDQDCALACICWMAGTGATRRCMVKARQPRVGCSFTCRRSAAGRGALAITRSRGEDLLRPGPGGGTGRCRKPEQSGGHAPLRGHPPDRDRPPGRRDRLVCAVTPRRRGRAPATLARHRKPLRDTGAGRAARNLVSPLPLGAFPRATSAAGIGTDAGTSDCGPGDAACATDLGPGATACTRGAGIAAIAGWNTRGPPIGRGRPQSGAARCRPGPAGTRATCLGASRTGGRRPRPIRSGACAGYGCTCCPRPLRQPPAARGGNRCTFPASTGSRSAGRGHHRKRSPPAHRAQASRAAAPGARRL